MLADTLSGWVESWGDAGRVLKGKPQATTRVMHQVHNASGRSGPRPRSSPSDRALPATSTDAVLWSGGGASVGAAVGVRSTGAPFGGGASANNPPGYTQVSACVCAHACVYMSVCVYGLTDQADVGANAAKLTQVTQKGDVVRECL